MATETPKLTRSRVLEIGETLKTLPQRTLPDKELSKREAVTILAPIIKKLRTAGYTIAQIAATLKDAGMPIGASSCRRT